MNNISLGQYVKGNSYLYKLDPRFKIIATIILMVSLFLIPANNINNLYVLLGFLAVLVVILLSGRINLLAVIKGLEPIIFVGAFTFILQVLYGKTGELLYEIPMSFSVLSILTSVALLVVMLLTMKHIRFKVIYMFIMFVLMFLSFVYIKLDPFGTYTINIYSSGLINGAFFFTRIVLVVIISTLLTITTSTTDINLGLEWVLHPLSYIKVPVGEISMMISLTLRFIPTLLIETDKILKAQASRGIDFNEGNLIDKIKQIVTLLIPMFVISINRAEDLANAMEVRGYVIGKKRTSIDELKFKVKDFVAFIFILLILGLSITAKVLLWE